MPMKKVEPCRNKSSSREGDNVWLGIFSSKDRALLVIIGEGTIDHSCYIKNVLFSVALKYGNEVFDDKWISQQDGAIPRQHYFIEE